LRDSLWRKSCGLSCAPLVRSGPEVPLAAAWSLRLGGSYLAISPLALRSSRATEERRGAVFDALAGGEASPPSASDSEGGPAKPLAAAVAPAALLMAARWQLSQFPTTLLEDEQTMRQVHEEAEASGAKVDPRVYAVVSYRLARKRLLRFTELVLSTFLGN